MWGISNMFLGVVSAVVYEAWRQNSMFVVNKVLKLYQLLRGWIISKLLSHIGWVLSSVTVPTYAQEFYIPGHWELHWTWWPAEQEIQVWSAGLKKESMDMLEQVLETWLEWNLHLTSSQKPIQVRQAASEAKLIVFYKQWAPRNICS